LLLCKEIHSTGIHCEKLQLRFTEHWEIVGLDESIKIVWRKENIWEP